MLYAPKETLPEHVRVNRTISETHTLGADQSVLQTMIVHQTRRVPITNV